MNVKGLKQYNILLFRSINHIQSIKISLVTIGKQLKETILNKSEQKKLLYKFKN